MVGIPPPSNEGRLAVLEIKLSSVEMQVSQIERKCEVLDNKMDEMRELLHRRPGWAVTIYITVMTSALTAMIGVFVARNV